MLSTFLDETMGHIRRNVTTIEELFEDTRPYDLGEERNIWQVFGKENFAEYLPLRSDMTGFEWALQEYRNDGQTS